jgi:hypothetical protein
MSRRHSRRARSTVVSAVVTLLGLNVGLFWYVRTHPELRDPLYYAKERLLAAQYEAPASPGRVTVVALGSSRSANSFHPPTAEAVVTAQTGRPCLAFNQASPGGGALTQLLHLRRMLARGIRPDVVLVEVNPAVMDEPETRFLRPDRVTREELAVLTEIGFADDQYLADWWEATLNPWFGFRFQLLGRVRAKWTPPGVPRMAWRYPDPTGWGPWIWPVTPESYRAALAVARQEHFDTLQKYHLGPVPVRALKEVFALCRREGITAVAVLTPEGSEFRSWYGPAAHAAAAELIALAGAATGGRVVDARGWLPDSAFADAHHIRAPEAAGFTAELTRRAIVPAVRCGE